MGVYKFRKKILATQGIDSTGNSTWAGTQTFGGAVTFTARRADPIQALTGASTGTQVTNYGITKIVNASATESGTGARLVYTIANPVAGVRKTLIVQADTTRTIQVRTATSLLTFMGSTFNALEWSTGGASTMGPPVAELIGITSAQWAVNSLGSTDGITQQGATA
jgi:hypothetical protein